MNNPNDLRTSKKLFQMSGCLLPLVLLIIGIFCTKAYGIEMERAAVMEMGYVGVGTVPFEKEGIKAVQIMTIRPGSPAEKARFQVDDIVLEIDGQGIDSPAAFTEYMNQTKAGQKLTFTILRDGKKKKISVVPSRLAPVSLRAKLRNRLGVSLRDQAEAARAKKEFDRAIEYYQQWLAADPLDKNSWYNLACAYAQKGETDKALEAFESAVDAGWDDVSRFQQDSSLVLIRVEKRFKAALEQAAENKAFDEPEGYTRHFIQMNSLGTYIVMLPPDYETSEKKYPLCLILHGHGSTETSHGKLADELNREGVIYVAPRDPYPHTEVFMDMRQPGWTAWPPYDFGADTLTYFGIFDRLNVEWFFACADDAKKHYRVLGDRIYILGHSQGAELASVCAALHPELVASYFSYAGFYPDIYLGKEFLDGLKRNNVKVYLAHCTDDKVVDPAESAKSEKAMTDAGVDCRLKNFRGEHSFTADVYSFAREWLDKEVRSKKSTVK